MFFRFIHRQPSVSWRHTKVAEEHGQENESVSHAQERDDQIQSEKEDLDELRFCKGEHEDAWQVGHRHAWKHLHTAKISIRVPALYLDI